MGGKGADYSGTPAPSHQTFSLFNNNREPPVIVTFIIFGQYIFSASPKTDPVGGSGGEPIGCNDTWSSSLTLNFPLTPIFLNSPLLDSQQ